MESVVEFCCDKAATKADEVVDDEAEVPDVAELTVAALPETDCLFTTFKVDNC